MTVEKYTSVVTEMKVIPMAGHDSVLLNLSGAHGPYFTRGKPLQDYIMVKRSAPQERCFSRDSKAFPRELMRGGWAGRVRLSCSSSSL
jgi:hypothetical protein